MRIMAMMKTYAICGVFATFLAYVDTGRALQVHAEATHLGKIGGSVVNDLGKPLEGARVHLGSDQPTMSMVRYVMTDKAGRFTIDRVPWGKYKVFVDKESDGYGDTGAAFYSGNKLYIATITPTKPTAEVTVATGPPCGTLSTKFVSDALSGKPLNPQITVWRDSDRGLFLTVTNRTGEVLIPSNVRVHFTIRVSGYEPWPADAEKGAPLVLSPHQVYSPVIKLRPLPSTQ